MEAYKLIKDRLVVLSCIFLIAFAFFVAPPFAYSSGKRVLKLYSEEPFEVRNGRIIYLEHCAPCHGKTGKGDGNYYASGLEPKPRNFTDTKYMRPLKDEYLFEIISKGGAALGKSPFCPPWGATLKEEEKVWNIITFLKTLYK